MSKQSIVVMYSGGLDSTLQAYRLGQKYQEVHLLTFDLSLTIGVEKSRKNIENIARACPNSKIIHHIINIDPTRKNFWKHFCEDYFTYCQGTSPAILCLSCKMAMLTETIRYCLKHGIHEISNGLTGTQSDHPEHLPEIINRFTKAMESYGISFVNTVYQISSREEEIAELQAAKIDTGVIIGASNVSHQPRCFVGVYSTLWKAFRPYNKEKIIAYFDQRKELIDQMLKDEPTLSEGEKSQSTWLEEGKPQTYTYEFGKNIDKVIGLALLPVWIFSTTLFRIFRNRK